MLLSRNNFKANKTRSVEYMSIYNKMAMRCHMSVTASAPVAKFGTYRQYLTNYEGQRKKLN